MHPNPLCKRSFDRPSFYRLFAGRYPWLSLDLISSSSALFWMRWSLAPLSLGMRLVGYIYPSCCTSSLRRFAIRIMKRPVLAWIGTLKKTRSAALKLSCAYLRYISLLLPMYSLRTTSHCTFISLVFIKMYFQFNLIRIYNIRLYIFGG